MTGEGLQASQKDFAALKKLFSDQDAASTLDPATVVYRVQWWTETEKPEGGLFWGVTELNPGKVGDEFFMTHGHFHANRASAEFYATASGTGMLIQMDEDRKTWMEPMFPGSIHYIQGKHAHRVANTGDQPLIFWASWPTDAGYDYGTIAERGFGARLVDVNGTATLVPND